MKLIDIHAHLNFSDYDADRAAVIARTVAAGCGVINVGTDLETSRQVVKLAEENNLMWATVGVHPHDAEREINWPELEKLAAHKKVVAIGECGLEINPKLEIRNPKQMKKQKEIFAKQIELALAVQKPLMIHCRGAYPELLDFLVSDFDIRNSSARRRGGDLAANLHFFAGTVAQAKQFLDLGWTLSFTGVITFPPKAGQPRADTYRELIKFVPTDRIMAETDAPFVAPAPHRGQRNEPLFVTEVIKRLAELKGVSPEQMAAQSLATARKTFALP